MLIEDIKNIKSGKADLRKFGITVGIVLGLFGGLFFWRGKWFYYYFFILSAAFLLLGLTLPVLLKPVQKVWMALAVVLGWVMTRVILCILFYLVVTPIGLVSRLAGKGFLDLRFDKESESYWIAKDTTDVEVKDYEKQF